MRKSRGIADFRRLRAQARLSEGSSIALSRNEIHPGSRDQKDKDHDPYADLRK